MRQRTDSRFDTLKVVMALFIVVLHTKLWPSVFIPLVRIAVPVFFIMSGYFFFEKYMQQTPCAKWLVRGVIF